LSLSQVRTNLIEHDQVLQLTESYWTPKYRLQSDLILLLLPV
jgi:hypothetical protein